MTRTIHTIRTEQAIRTIFDGLVDRRYNGSEKKAVYMTFDLHIGPTTKATRIAFHILKFRANVLIATDQDWLFSKFKVDRDWKFCSSHDSCWADSLMHRMQDIVSAANKENGHKDTWECLPFVSGFSLLNIEDIKHVQYWWDNYGQNDRILKDLVPAWMLEEA